MNDQSNTHSLHSNSSIGAILRSEREKQGLDLNDIFQRTKIRPNILESIEKDQFDKISSSSDIFLISFLKSYAQALKLDPAPIVKRYRDAISQKEDIVTKGGMERLGISPQLLIISLVIIVFIVFVVMIVPSMKSIFSKKVQENTSLNDVFVGELDNNVDFSYQNKPVTFTEHHAKIISTPPPKKEPVEVSQSEPEPSTSIQQSSSNTLTEEKYFLRLKATEKTWLKITVDDQSTNEFMLKPGDTLSKEANKEFQILLGNATGVEIFLNEEPVDIDGRSGQVMTLILPR
ncbi:MAG: helix-turn-helix domain-containing protein [Candidatus Magnetomorum sp.]|nr:helix-turn-helix domain-containing protein [Candidatus Magnetomorum sp.]